MIVSNPKARPLTILYNNIQGLIDIRDLKSKEPQLNMTKLYELHGHIFTTKAEVIILNEKWLKKLSWIHKLYFKTIKFGELIEQVKLIHGIPLILENIKKMVVVFL